MLEIAGKPVLEHLIEYLNTYGVDEVMVNLHYLPDKIMKYFGPRLLYSYEPELLGEEGTIHSLSRFLKNDYTVVMNGDTLTNMNLNRLFMMSGGKNIKYMDGSVYAGVRILAPAYFLGNTVSLEYQDGEAFWVDMGSPAGLERAKRLYAEKVNNLRNLREQGN